jgi:hypothetical protein
MGSGEERTRRPMSISCAILSWSRLGCRGLCIGSQKWHRPVPRGSISIKSVRCISIRLDGKFVRCTECRFRW